MSDVRHSWVPVVAPFASECLCETHANPRDLELYFKEGIISTDPCFKCLSKCLTMKYGAMSSTGEIDAQKVADIVPNINLELVEKCIKNLEEPDLCQKAHLMFKCIHDSVVKQYEL